MRLVWQSNSPTTTSAYGQQTALFVPRIAAQGHDVVIAGPYSFGGSPIEWNGFPVLPCARDSAGCDTILANHEHFRADWTMVLADPFGLLKVARDLTQIRLALLMPVDCDPLGEGDVTVLRESAAVPVAISRFGQRVLKGEGVTDPLYCPHAVDTALFQPGGQRPYRDTVPGMGDETFVIGMIAMNRDLNRKGWHEQMLAFSRFHARHPDSFLALHTSPVNNPGLNLAGMAARLGITSAVAWPDAYMYDMNMITQEQLVTWYNGLDVLSMASYGEGFGVPLIEAQSTGVPVITTDGSAMSELCGSGWTVSGSPFWAPGHGAWWRRPDAEDIEQAYEAAWQAREDGTMPVLKKAARDFALTYDIDRVFTQYMKPVLAELEARIG
jgi:glycosyltransferase involved in cell wall biosynthesis